MLCIMLMFCAIFVSCFLLYHLPPAAVIYPALLCCGIGLIICIFDFVRIKHEHEKMQRIRSLTDIMAESFPKVQNIKDKDYQEIIRLFGEEHTLYKRETKRRHDDMIEYYTVWAHQIKTPIASMRLHLQNEDTALSRKLSSDLHRIEQYVEMVLTYLRLNSDSTDYLFREYDIDAIVKSAVRKFSSDFIEKKLKLEYRPVNASVVTDAKWLSFVIEQVISNALKYTKSGTITISWEDDSILRIKDTGIGIAAEDLPRIFENGYTGCNGRTEREASGIGLYLCKRICNNLGHKITADSKLDAGTTIDIDFSRRELEIE